MRRRLVYLALPLLALCFLPFAVRPRSNAPPPPSREFWVIGWGQPNSLSHLTHLAKFFHNAEVDLLLEPGGELVGAHDPEQLQQIERGELRDPLRLPALLVLPFERVFLDMKDTLFERSDRPGEGFPDAAAAAHALRAVERAGAAIAAADRREDVHVMVYFATDAMLATARAAGVRLMLQGYPRNDAESLQLVRSAADHGMTHLCIPLRRVTPAVLAESRRLGITQVPYTFFEEGWGEARYRSLFEGDLGGLILPPAKGPHFARLLTGE